MPEVRGEEQSFWLELRRYHLGIASVIARKLGLKRCPECGHDLRPQGGGK
jgi:hypothetical protein